MTEFLKIPQVFFSQWNKTVTGNASGGHDVMTRQESWTENWDTPPTRHPGRVCYLEGMCCHSETQKSPNNTKEIRFPLSLSRSDVRKNLQENIPPSRRLSFIMYGDI